MFHPVKPIKPISSAITESSTITISQPLPKGINKENVEEVMKLSVFLELLLEKFIITREKLSIKFDSESSNASLVLYNRIWGLKYTQGSEYDELFNFLTEFGATSKQEKIPGAKDPHYNTNTVITLELSKVSAIITGLNLLTTPEPEKESIRWVPL